MKQTYYHGSSTCIDGMIWKGTCVSIEKCNALTFARRRGQGVCYIYSMVLDSAADLERHEEAGIVDWRLVRNTAFSERVVVTDELIAECKAIRRAAVSENEAAA